jgi:hypothetical protein
VADLTAEVEETTDFDRLGKWADRRREFRRGNCGLAHSKLLWILGKRAWNIYAAKNQRLQEK